MFDGKFPIHINAVTIYILKQIKIEATKIMVSCAEIWQLNVEGIFVTLKSEHNIIQTKIGNDKDKLSICNYSGQATGISKSVESSVDRTK